ncbi:hypothetical protein [Vibrio cyclitrophicus]|uniref:hypothetical protein n=1 Tax=Vibrio cyclitrophicus TaxID=47951 RepID=UPI000C85E768|nr:hypothetical protein [Vibrio cyclitrophicus]PMG84215.1 hypothetical protein BCU82_19700 [Vibrio cyclitrophicus]
MSNYYTNFIDPGNSGGSVPTPDTSIPFTPNMAAYSCRFCNSTFATDNLRIQHEWDVHPSKNPQLHIFKKPIGSTTLTVHTKLSPDDIEFTHCEQIFINGKEIDLDIAPDQLASKDKHFFNVVAMNKGSTREFKIDVDIADPIEIAKVDEFFWMFLSRDDFTEELITQFIHACSELNSTVNYVDGIVKYLQGIMAKDGKTQVLTFEDFEPRFNQSRSKLQQFDTPLSKAIQAVIDFNQNQFDSRGLETTPFLNKAMAFFSNNPIINLEDAILSRGKKLPIDRVTALLVDDVIYDFDEHSIESIQEHIERLPRRNVSLSDRKKFQFLLLKKAYNTGHSEIVKKMKKRLSSDESFDLTNIEE